MIEQNLSMVKDNIAAACNKAGRRPDDITLIAVSKTKPVEQILEAYEHGQRDFGENRVQELLDKYDKLPGDIRWHLIGHLQTNKVKYIVDKVVLIHSVDSVKLAGQINAEAAKHNKIMDVLLEINVAAEESKFGFSMAETENAIVEISRMPHICVKGFMTVAPFVENSEEVRIYFKELHQFYVDMKCKSIDNISMSVLSMGMTGDYSVAIEEGSTMIRVGTGIFGTR